MQEFLFQLLRIGLQTRTPVDEDLSALQRFKRDDWESLFEIAKHQSVAAIVYDGVESIISILGKGFFDLCGDISFWDSFLDSWKEYSREYYVAGNMKQLAVIADIQERWAQCGIKMMLMKGMAMGYYYPVPKYRCPGDIDCYLFDDYARGNEIAKTFASKVDERWYKHSQIKYADELIENHRFFVHTREGRSSKALERILVNTLDTKDFDTLPGTGALLPPPMFNALFLTYHALTHFLEEGLRLKQLLDWAMFLDKNADEIDWSEFYSICEKYHMRRFAEVATDVAVNYLGVKLENTQVVTSSPFTTRVLESTFNDKDYVFSSGEGGWKNRLHIVRNLWKYRWKYYQIYQHSVIRQLWYYVTGFLFKTE